MPPDTPSFARWTVLLAVLTGAAAAVLVVLVLGGSGSAAATQQGGWTNSVSGPVGPPDRAMLTVVRQAALWQVPVGQQAQQMATRADVRGVAGQLAGDLSELADQVNALAIRLAVALPSQPTAEQQAWSAEISSRSGVAYDRVMVEHLRATCVETLAAIDIARAETRNPDIRVLADHAKQVVGRHLQYLDGTGLVAAR